MRNTRIRSRFDSQVSGSVGNTEAKAPEGAILDTIAFDGAPLPAETKEDATKRLNPLGIPEVEIKSETFKITTPKVKDAEGKEHIAYQNGKEPYFYAKVPSLATALKLLGAEMGDDKVKFLGELFPGEKSGQAIADLVEIFNDNLEQSANRNRYQKVLAHYTPLTEENIVNANASIVRNFMKTQSVSDETAVQTLASFGVIPKDFTLDMFRSNKGKR